MFSRTLIKPDGRPLRLYSRRPISGELQALSPVSSRIQPNPQMRWHPLREEWVSYAAYRQHRTFLPPTDHNPLAPTTDSSNPTELPAGDYDVAVFENLFPAFAMSAVRSERAGSESVPARGTCEVVVFTQDPTQSLGRLPLSHLELLIEVWAERYRELGKIAEVQYVLPFENRGVEVGVTLHHPHGQIYAYPFIPPVPARELAAQEKHFAVHGRGLLEELIASEIANPIRVLYSSAEVVAFMPAFARYAYEVWIAPTSGRPALGDLRPAECREFARALKTVLLKFDALWNRPFPYVMAFHQAPTDGLAHPEAHVHVELYPALRMPNRLKYLAGSELGAGVFTSDTLPEEKAAELRAVGVSIE
jgi:UDPglucose--hexose-1-phosphate uridylyltransferase